MSAETRAAAAEYLIFLSTSCPELYSMHVLDERCRRAGAHTIAGVGGSLVFGCLADPAYPLTTDVAAVLFVMGAWNLIAFLQLRCVRKLTAQLPRRNSYSGPPGLLP
jgi:ammonia channel protein AmtB